MSGKKDYQSIDRSRPTSPGEPERTTATGDQVAHRRGSSMGCCGGNDDDGDKKHGKLLWIARLT